MTCPQGVRFGGVDEYLQRSAALSGAVDGSKASASVLLRFNGADNVENAWFGNDTDTMRLRRRSNGKVEIFASGTGGESLRVISSISVIDDDLYHSVLMSCDTNFTAGNKLFSLAIDDVSDPGPTVTDASVAFNIAYSTGATDWFVGASGGGISRLDGDISDFWFSSTEYIEFSIEANRRRFISDTGGAVDPGAAGSIVFLRGPAAAFATNLGTGGDFTVNGTLTDSPDDPPCFVPPSPVVLLPGSLM